MVRSQLLTTIAAHATATILGILTCLLLFSPPAGIYIKTPPIVRGDDMSTAPTDPPCAAKTVGLSSRSVTRRTHHEAWSCADYPKRCAIVYHAFSLSLGRLRQLESSGTLGDEFWLAFDAALHLAEQEMKKKRSGVWPALIPIFLVTNYPRALIDSVKHNMSHQGAASGSEWPFEIVTVPFFRPGRESDTPTAQRTFASKPDGLLIALGDSVERVLYLDSDTRYYRRPRNSGSEAESLRVQWCPIAAPTTLAADGGGLVELLDVLEVSPMAMVPEFNCFRDGASWLYTDILYEGRHEPRHHPQLLDATVIPFNANQSASLEERKATKKKREKKRHPFHIFSPFELQFNTGVVAFRPKDGSVASLLNHWSHLHRSLPRCVNDTVAWDQCSLPHALRTHRSLVNKRWGEKVDVVSPLPMPFVFNVREALGRGCGSTLYDLEGNLIERQIIISHKTENKRLALARLLQNDDISSIATINTRLIREKMTCFEGDAIVDCYRKLR